MRSTICSRIHRRFTSQNTCLLGTRRLSGFQRVVLGSNRLGKTVINRPIRGLTRLTKVALPPATQIVVNRMRTVNDRRPFTFRGLSPVLTVCQTGSFTRTMSGTRTLVDFNKQNRATMLCATTNGRTRVHRFRGAIRATHILVGAPTSRKTVNSLFGFHLSPSLALNYNA